MSFTTAYQIKRCNFDLFDSAVEEKLLEKQSSVINTKVWFKFNEGYTNAVRRTTRVQDFL